MKNGYPNEKFSNAVDSMAVSSQPIQRRIADAFVFNLIMLKPEELPEEIRTKFIEVKKQLTSVQPVGDEGSIYATTQQMDTDTAVDIARAIVSMADVVACDYYN